eukprot:GHUV01038198.1.p1 GENE.GHUV01038198.1~~GHUV01038198.1.p1  ORF type:complete len:177 (-),score=16.01 GHUV01038198.1:417-947(-)
MCNEMACYVLLVWYHHKKRFERLRNCCLCCRASSSMCIHCCTKASSFKVQALGPPSPPRTSDYLVTHSSSSNQQLCAQLCFTQVVREAYPDPTAFDTKSEYYDASSSEDKPKWYMVDWKLVRKLKRQMTLEELKSHKDGALAGMALFNRPRLSVQPVTNEQWEFVLSLENEEQQQD